MEKRHLQGNLYLKNIHFQSTFDLVSYVQVGLMIFLLLFSIIMMIELDEIFIMTLSIILLLVLFCMGNSLIPFRKLMINGDRKEFVVSDQFLGIKWNQKTYSAEEIDKFNFYVKKSTYLTLELTEKKKFAIFLIIFRRSNPNSRIVKKISQLLNDLLGILKNVEDSQENRNQIEMLMDEIYELSTSVK